MSRTTGNDSERARRASVTRTAVALCAILLAAFAATLAAAPRAAAAPSLTDLQREAKRTREQMKSLQTELQSTGERLAAAQQRLDEINVRLQLSRRKLSRAQDALDDQREILAERAASMYKSDQLSWLDILSSLKSFSDIDTVKLLQRTIADEDRRVEDEAEDLARAAQDLERQIEDEHAAAVTAQTEIQTEQIALDEQLAERQAILQDVTRRIKKILASGGLGAALRMAADGQFTQLTWAKALLVAMRLPVTADNVAAITAWEMAEGGHWYNTAYYNPLNTTQSMPGATSMNSVGVKAYTSWKQGLEATVKTLKNGYYDDIIAALRRGDDAEAVAAAVGASPWGTGDFSGLIQ